MITVAPSPARAEPIARPIPAVEPVTSASLPVSCRSMEFSSFSSQNVAEWWTVYCTPGFDSRGSLALFGALLGPSLHLQAGNPVELLRVIIRQHACLHKSRELLAITRQRVVLLHGEARAPNERGSEKSQSQQRDRKRGQVACTHFRHSEDGLFVGLLPPDALIGEAKHDEDFQWPCLARVLEHIASLRL